MEYVEGIPLDKFCDQRKLDLEGRVKIFIQVSDAVCYLHEHLVVHRDLKQSNILVTGEGVVKLLDFGIAKQRIPTADAGLTGVQHRIMTPSYASPEQFSGSPVTKASDIYTLGVILYQLLTGSLPHASPAEKLTTEPSAPSSRIREDLQRTPETPRSFAAASWAISTMSSSCVFGAIRVTATPPPPTSAPTFIVSLKADR